MSEGIPYADLVILALIAIFILLRLRSVLGDKIGNDDPSYFHRPASSVSDKAGPIIQLDEKSLKPKLRDDSDAYAAGLPNGPVAETIAAIKLQDPEFTASHFLDGAKVAFEMVFDAFAKGDKATLQMLLSKDLLEHFNAEIANRDMNIHQTEHTLISVKAQDITQASLEKNIARLSVHFISEQVTVIRSKEGKIVDGNPSDIHTVEDHWVFERDVTSKSPNWKVIET